MNYEVAFPHLGIKIDKLPRVAFEILGMPIYLYGLTIACGVLAGILYASIEAKRTNQNPEQYTDFAFYGLVCSVIGARLYYVAFMWDSYKDNLLSIFYIRSGGLAIYGGVIAAIISAFIYSRINKINFGLFADTTAPALLLGQAIGRWGNFFNREVFGGYTDSVFAMQYLANQVDNLPEAVADKIILVNNASYIQVHPTFLYESLWSFSIFIIINLYKRHKKFNGEILGIYLLGYGLGRAWIEGIRTDQLFLWGTSFAVSQIFSCILVIFACIFIFVGRKNASNSIFRLRR